LMFSFFAELAFCHGIYQQGRLFSLWLVWIRVGVWL